MFEPTEHEVNQDVRESMALFERAQVGDVAPIAPKVPGRILLVLDGSRQDPIGIELCRRLRARFDAAVNVLDAREWVTTGELADETARSLAATAVSKGEGDSFEQILRAAEQSGCDLIVLPSPYGRDLEAVGADSTGTVIDVLLARSPVPLLVTRQPLEMADEPFARALFVLVGENEAAIEAAAWAAGLVRRGGAVEMLLVLEQEVLENVRRLMQEVDPNVEVDAETLTRALAKSHVRLHRAIQKAAGEAGFQYRLGIHQQGDAPLGQLTQPAVDTLLVLALERSDHLSVGHVHDRIRHTPLPVLVVPHGSAAST